MPGGDTQYQRIGGQKWFYLTTPVSLWRGEDHLLLKDKVFFTEEYRRFFYKDIQAIIVRKTPDGMILNLVILGVIAALLIAGTAGPGLPSPPWWIMMGVFLLILLVNLGLGATCQCHLKTAVTLQRLPVITRIRRARKLISLLRPIIARVQGEIPDEEIRQRAIEIALHPPPPPTQTGARANSQGPGVPGEQQLPLRHYRGAVHIALFEVLALGCLVNCANYFYPGTLLAAVSLVILLGQLGLNVAAIVKQRRTDIPKGARVTVFLALGYIVISYVWLTSGRFLFRGPAGLTSPVYGALTGSTGEAMSIFAAICSGVLGTVGAIQMLRHRMRTKPGAATGPPPVPESE